MAIQAIIEGRRINVFPHSKHISVYPSKQRVIENAVLSRIGEKGVRISGNEVSYAFFCDDDEPSSETLSKYEEKEYFTKTRWVLSKQYPFICKSTSTHLNGWCTMKQRRPVVLEFHGDFQIEYDSPNIVAETFGKIVPETPAKQSVPIEKDRTNVLSGIDV